MARTREIYEKINLKEAKLSSEAFLHMVGSLYFAMAEIEKNVKAFDKILGKANSGMIEYQLSSKFSKIKLLDQINKKLQDLADEIGDAIEDESKANQFFAQFNKYVPMDNY